MSQGSARRQRRIAIPVTHEQEQILRAAADLSGETLTGFVLAVVATERAAHVVSRVRQIEISTAAFGRFVAALDGPAEDVTVVRRYATKPSQIPAR